MSRPPVSIIVLHWRIYERTARCLESLREQRYPALRVLVVDNGSHNGSLERIQAEFPEVETLALPENRGFAGGMNAGIEACLRAGSAYILLLNNDAIAPPDLAERLVAAQQAHPEIGILSPTVVREDRPGVLAGLGCTIRRYGIELIGWDTPDDDNTGEPVPIDAVFGCAMLISRAVFERIGLLDERFFFYYEDIDFCSRARGAGFGVAYLPGIAVQHAVAGSTRAVRGLRDFYLARSRQLFFRKYRRGPDRLAFTALELVDMLRVARAKLIRGEHADAVGYIAGALVGAIMDPPAGQRPAAHTRAQL